MTAVMLTVQDARTVAAAAVAEVQGCTPEVTEVILRIVQRERADLARAADLAWRRSARACLTGRPSPGLQRKVVELYARCDRIGIEELALRRHLLTLTPSTTGAPS
jgi:hypothetical protein